MCIVVLSKTPTGGESPAPPQKLLLQSPLKMTAKLANWEASWRHVGGNWNSQGGTKLGQVEAKLINFGTNLEPSWALLGQVGPCWGHVGTRLAQVGAKLDQVEAKLG